MVNLLLSMWVVQLFISVASSAIIKPLPVQIFDKTNTLITNILAFDEGSSYNSVILGISI